MARQEYLTPANFLRGATAAALLTGALSPRETDAQAWPVWSGPHAVTIDAPNKLAVYSERPGEDVVATVWNMKDPCTVSIIVAPSGGKRVDINGPVAGNAYVVRNETLLAQRVRSMQENTLKGREDLAACPEKAGQVTWLGANVPAGFKGDLPSWTSQVSAPLAASTEAKDQTQELVWFNEFNVHERGENKLSLPDASVVLQIWDKKNANTLRMEVVKPGQEKQTDWAGKAWQVRGPLDKLATRVLEMAKEVSEREKLDVKAYWNGDDVPQGFLKNEVAPATQAAPAQVQTRTVENGMQTLPLPKEMKEVAEHFLSVDGNVPAGLEAINADAHSIVLEEGKTYLVISQSVESKVLNSVLPQKEDRTHALVLRGNGQRVAFTNILPGQMWIGSVDGKLKASYFAERAAEAYGKQFTATFRQESAPAISASFTANEAEQSVWNPYIGSWVVETGNKSYSVVYPEHSSRTASTEAQTQEAGLKDVRSYDITKEKPADPVNYTLVIGWNGENAESTRVVVVEAGTRVNTWELRQGTAWVVSGTREAVLKRAKEMADEIAKGQATARRNPIYAGTQATNPQEFESAPYHWSLSR